MFPLVLLPIEVDMDTQEKCWKENMVEALGSDGDKMIFILLAEVIAFYVGLTTIDIG